MSRSSFCRFVAASAGVPVLVICLATSAFAADGTLPNAAELTVGYVLAFDNDYPASPATMTPLAPSADPGPADSGDSDGDGGLLSSIHVGAAADSLVNFPPTGGESMPSWACSLGASDPYKSVRNGRQAIEGNAWEACAGQGWERDRLVVRVQQYRSFGYWVTKYAWDSGWLDVPYIGRTIWWYCAAGSGVQTYRILATGYARDGKYSKTSQSVHYLRVRCPS
jgi:hypothetical protein